MISSPNAPTTTIFGYGSLMDYTSVKSTLPSASNFRKGKLLNFTRFYSLVSVSGIINGFANWETMEVAALAVKPSPGGVVLGCLFDIPETELIPYLEREHRYKPIQICVEVDTASNSNAWTVIEQSDEEYKNTMTQDQYNQRVGRYYDGQLWGRRDILPLRNYMLTVITAAKFLGGDEYLDNMLDETYLADECTSLRQYLERFPERNRCRYQSFI
eukprot:gene4310-8570_t